MSRPTSFYYAFLALPRSQREAIIAVWDFCRTVDDVVDEPGSSAVREEMDPRAQLQEWRAELERCFAGAPRTPVGRRLQPWIATHRLSRQPFADLIDGVEMDLDRTRYPTFDALYEYCWRVASTVGLICIEIFDVRTAAAREYAIDLGVALQLTNIIRDVAPDLAAGRVYLPGEDLQRFGCTEGDLAGGRPSAPVRNLMAFQTARAREYFARAAARLPHAERRRLVAAEIMGRIYRDLLRRVERAGYDVFSGRIAVSRPRQAVLAATTWLRVQVGLDASA